jgi:hypothetical protein
MQFLRVVAQDCAVQLWQSAAMPLQTSKFHSPFETSNLDLAVTKLAAGSSVRYIGPHQGVFRFECMKVVALKAREGENVGAEQGAELLRRFFSFH